MSSKPNKSDYVAVPCEEPKQEPNYNKENYISPGGTSLPYTNCQCVKKRSWKLWKRTLITFMLIFLGSRVLFSGLAYYGQTPQFAKPYPPSGFFAVPGESACNPTYKWNGPSELLIDPRDISGLILKVKGMSAHGSVLVIQDPSAKYVTVKNKIYLSEESLQNEVDINIDIIDEDYSITIETPSFDGPRPTTKCVLIDTTIIFPKEVDFWRSFIIDVPNGAIKTENLKNIEFAYTNFKTKNGNIQSKILNSAISEIYTVNGHIQGSIITGESLDVRTVNGAVSVEALINEGSEFVDVTTKSINGHLEFSVPELKENQRINLKAGSVNGGVAVNMPDSFVGNFSATAFVGYVHVEGHDITFTKNLRNAKIGYKTKPDNDGDDDGDDDDDDGDDDGDDDDDSKTRYRHGHRHNKIKSRQEESDGSNIVLEAVTGAVELYFVE